MDNWMTYVWLVCLGFAAGAMSITWDHQDEMAELKYHQVMFDALENAGANRWCELVMAGEIVPEED